MRQPLRLLLDGRRQPHRRPRGDLLRGAKTNSDEIRRILGIYDNAYASLIEQQNPRLFREFLLGAPKLFLDIGEKMGAMSHITSFWQYRFPAGAPEGVERGSRCWRGPLSALAPS